jgi:tRNA(Leu) C34 or U34 (ribose-2'-O)-methylase TrmL
VATNSKLHLIKPMGFKLDDSHMKRSAVNYLENLNYEVYENWDDFKSKNEDSIFRQVVESTIKEVESSKSLNKL